VRLTWSPRTIWSPECLSEYEIWVYKDQTGFAFAPSFLPFSITMSAIAKSNSPVAPVTTEPKDWTKAPTPELQSGSEDESDVLDTKAKECCRRKQVKREEKQRREEAERRAREEVEARAHEEAERAKVEAEWKAREEAERQAHEQAERQAHEQAERQAHEQAEKDKAEVQQRAAEVAARQRALAQEVSKKRVREELEAGLSDNRSEGAR